ncbi:MAG: type III-A CRISPR-associated RAMP protein Csm4 [Cyanobacteriota bacterium]
MSQWRLVRLNFGQNPVHFGELGIGMEETSERVRSDTLFSAWITAYARLFGKQAVEQLLTGIQETPLFRLSSTFVYRQIGDRTIDYLPRLIELPPGYPMGDDFTFAKTFKKLAYLPLDVWQRWYQQEGFTPGDRCDLEEKTNSKAEQAGGALWQAGTFSYSEAFQKHQIPKVAIDRTTRATNFYSIGFVQFRAEAQQQAGLYFLLHFPENNPQLEADLQAALEFLGEEGLGGERSSGAGRWRSLVEFDQQNSYGLISLFWQKDPLPPELFNEKAKYTLHARRGWMGSPSGRQLRRKTVQMFGEGSVFPIAPNGQLADVTPDRFDSTQPNHHRIYRSGISLSLPIKLAS